MGRTDEEVEALRQEMQKTKSDQAGFLRYLSRNGYMIRSKDIRVFAGRKSDRVPTIKADLDLELAIDMLTLADRCDRQTLFSGDGDFVPLVHAIGMMGVRIEVVSTQEKRGATVAAFLVDAADDFTDLKDEWKFFERPKTSIPGGGVRSVPR
jgi:uncharacterized LabA/DUF88 family protein